MHCWSPCSRVKSMEGRETNFKLIINAKQIKIAIFHFEADF
jgi:hypothetical protein